jgi:flagellar biosynthesis protein FlhF
MIRQEGASVRLKTFRAFSLDEALEAVHADLGTDAAILHTRTFRRGGLFGIGGRELVEVIASEVEPDTSVLPGVTRPSEPISAETTTEAPVSGQDSVMGSRARRAYSAEVAGLPPSDPQAAEDAAPIEPSLSSGSLVVDRERTRALARAMEIRLERQRAAREAAGVEGPDDLVGADSAVVPLVDSPAHAPAHASADAPIDSEPSADPEVAAPVPSESTSSTASVIEETTATSFVIGPGGVLHAEDEPESSPRVIALETTTVTPDEINGMPVAEVFAEVVAEVVVESPADDVPERPSPAERAGAEPTSPAGISEERIDHELDSIGETVQRVLAQDVRVVSEPSSPHDPGFGDPLASAYAELIGQEFTKDLADRVLVSLEASLDHQARRDPREVRKALLREIADLVPTEESLEVVVPRDGRPRTIAFVGPTGVGKTTTLAKIAATLSLREGLKVGLVTADTYRISAVEQLKTYAEILGCRLEVAGDPTAMKRVLADCEGLDAVLIDTPGRSQNDTDSLAELRALMDAARPHETHLVLAGTAAERVLLREAEAFSGLGPDRVVLTKLDEAVAFGMLVSVVRRIGRRISWVTTGQEVPKDVEWATGSRIADLVLGGAVKS